MIYRDFLGNNVSLLGFGTMRLPLLEDGSIDEKQVEEMTDYAISHGVNYFDTAWPYHSGLSESLIGRILKKYDRNQFFIATKFPGHQTFSSYDPKGIFEAQLEKCQVDYFDYYLLHNVHDKAIDEVYLNPKWGIYEYFLEQKRQGKIKHLGFSTHASLEGMKRFLEICGKDMEFCQIQMNYLDWSLQDAKAKYDLLAEYNIPIIVMEPVRGGKLAKLSEENEAKLKAVRPEDSTASWAFRYLQNYENVKVVLSGMSNMEQMADNVNTFAKPNELSEDEMALVFEIAEGLKDSIPCTSCRYCCDGCPMGLDIPYLLATYNEAKFSPGVTTAMLIDCLPDDKKPAACISCGQCTKMCPQNIDIPKELQEFSELYKTMPNWVEICRQREAAQK